MWPFGKRKGLTGKGRLKNKKASSFIRTKVRLRKAIRDLDGGRAIYAKRRR